MKIGCFLTALAASASCAFGAEHGEGVEPAKALQLLIEGNSRYVAGKELHPDLSLSRRGELAKGQKPFAIVLSCSDSRVPPELVFDQGLGDLFVIRVAGNVVDDHVIGSIEYAVEHLGARLIVVLGHQRCGAVQAAVAGGEAGGHVSSLVHSIRPAVEAARKDGGELLDTSVHENVQLVVHELANSEPVLKHALTKKEILIVGAYYKLDTGTVDVLK